jgi:hypothetical protein
MNDDKVHILYLYAPLTNTIPQTSQMYMTLDDTCSAILVSIVARKQYTSGVHFFGKTAGMLGTNIILLTSSVTLIYFPSYSTQYFI